MTALFGTFLGKLLKLLGSPRSAGVAKNTVEKQIPVTSLKGGESANRSMGFPAGFLLVVLPSAKRTLCASG